MKTVLSFLLAILIVLTVVLLMASASEVFGQTGALTPSIYPVFNNVNGITPAALGFICTTSSGTTIPLATFREFTNTTANQNPIRLNSSGRAVNGSTLVPIFLSGSLYRFALYAAGTGNTCNSVTVGAKIWEMDNVYDFGALLGAGLITVTTLNNRQFCVTGTDFGAKFTNAVALLPSTGGIVDCSNLQGAQTISTDVFTGVTKPIRLLWPSGTASSASSLTIPVTIAVDFSPGGILSMASATTATINGTTSCAASQCFAGSGNVVFGRNNITVLPQWYGAIQDASTDASAAFQKAITSACASGSTSLGSSITITSGEFALASGVTVPFNCHLSWRGNARASALRWTGGNTANMIAYLGSGSGADSQTIIEEIKFVTASATGIIAIKVGDTGSAAGFSNFTVRKCMFQNMDTALQTNKESDAVVFEDNWLLSYNSYGVRAVGGSTNSGYWIQRNHFQGGISGSWAVLHTGGANINIENNIIESGTAGAKGISLTNISAFSIRSNYFEVNSAFAGGDGPFLAIAASETGVVENNITTGDTGTSVITMNATTVNVRVGPNTHAASGGTPTNYIAITAGASDISIYGGLLGTTNPYSGTPCIASSSTGFIHCAPAFALGTTTASSGIVRVPNATSINWRNAANSQDIGLIVNSGNNLTTVGGTTYPATIQMYTGAASGVLVPAAGGAQILGAGLQMGAPTGGDKGAGTINVAGGIYLNNSLYTNPDYVFESYLGISEPSQSAAAQSYPGLPTLEEVHKYIQEHRQLPRVMEVAKGGELFSRTDALLEKLEEAYLYILQLNHRLAKLEEQQ